MGLGHGLACLFLVCTGVFRLSGRFVGHPMHDYARMITRLFAAEAAFDPLLAPFRVRADRIMVAMNLFLLFVCALLAPLRSSWMEWLLIGVPTLLLSFFLLRHHPGALLTRLFMASSFMVFTGLIIHQTGGDIEAHFSAFGLIGVLLYYRDWRTIAAATVVIYLHHLILGYAQTLGSPVFVFDSPDFWPLFALHVAYFLPFVGMMGYLAIWLRREGYESQHVIDLAKQIVQGNLMEENIAKTEADTPLINAVRLMKSRLLDLLRVMPIAAAVIRIDTDRIVNVNTAWVRTIGPIDTRHTQFGQSPIWADQDTWRLLVRRLHEARDKLIDKVEVVLRKSDGSPILCELSMILHEDIVPVMAILTVEDITLRRRAEETMQRLAFRDMLTDLPNRTSLHMTLELAIQDWKSRKRPFAVIMMDLDGFKPVNDQYGHDAGDEVLRVIGARLNTTNREGDLVSRLGGDEFAVVLQDCPTDKLAREIAQRFIAAVSCPIHLSGVNKTIHVGASAGVAHIADGGDETAEALLKRADEALYAAKRAGKNRVN
jgi:diguanylate cyclase (GGDEF)-like protein